MAREHNFLFGRGEKLSMPVEVPKGGGDKNPPYPFAKARERITQKLSEAQRAIESLPSNACPGDEAVAVIQMHPRYISKSDFPSVLLEKVGLRAIGSRSRKIAPESWGTIKHPDEATTEEIFVAGKRSDWKSWSIEVGSWSEETPGANQLCRVETVRAFEATEKLKGLATDTEKKLLEVVLHDQGPKDVLRAFISFAEANGASPVENRKRKVHGLTFIPVWATKAQAQILATFSFVRVARGMPQLRPFNPLTRGVSFISSRVNLPNAPALDPNHRAVIFDGGVPAASLSAVAPWVNLIEPIGIGNPMPEYESHGLAVTSAFLFGHLQPNVPPLIPLCNVDHVRILDKSTGVNDFMCIDALDRIVDHLENNQDRYDLANISLGPELAVDDDDITQWTAVLDDLFAHGQMLTTVAAGNGGEGDPSLKLNRIQPPADGVNVLSVGASIASDSAKRASYSCIGPGRSPGLVKPDGVAFGGTSGNEFGVLSPNQTIGHVMGTSFAAPLALRAAAAIMVQVGHASVGLPAEDTQLGPLAARALMIHQADSYEELQSEVGWGLLECNPAKAITCEDNEAMVLYQGELPVGEHLRLPIPLPKEKLLGKVSITATLLIAPQVDSAHPGNYTIAGVAATFRPHSDKFKTTVDGELTKIAAHPKSQPFFSQSNLYSGSEFELREDGHKWEPCLRTCKTFQANSLHEPCFDLYYNHRDGLTAATNPVPIPYAVVVTVKAKKVPDLYNRVYRTWTHILIPVKPRVRIQIR